MLIDESSNGMGKLGAIVVDATLVTSHAWSILMNCRHAEMLKY